MKTKRSSIGFFGTMLTVAVLACTAINASAQSPAEPRQKKAGATAAKRTNAPEKARPANPAPLVSPKDGGGAPNPTPAEMEEYARRFKNIPVSDEPVEFNAGGQIVPRNGRIVPVPARNP